MAILVACICIINIVLWIILLIRFKKLFSTDKIIKTTTEKMNKLVMEIDNATERNIFLTDASAKKIQNLLADADKNMELFVEASKRLRDMIAEAEKFSRRNEVKSPIYEPVREVIREEYKQKPANETIKKNINTYIQNSKKYSNNESESKQQELFGDNLNEQSVQITSSGTGTNVTENGTAYKEIPLVITRVYEEQPVPETNKKKNITKEVQKLYDQGYTVQQIANELSCSITEVQLIIDMCE